MTIDKAIAMLKFNNKHIADLENDDLQQLAEWLEELKSYRASVFSGYMTQKMLKEEYNKAIDDFADKFISLCDDGEFMARLNEFSATTILELAEQLKAGGENEESI